MRLPIDDEIYNVNAVWLGPPGKTLPFRARYIAYGVGGTVYTRTALPAEAHRLCYTDHNATPDEQHPTAVVPRQE